MYNTINSINKTKEMNNNLKNLSDLFNLTLKQEKKEMLTNIASRYHIDLDELLKVYLSSVVEPNINESSVPVINQRKCLASTKGLRQCSRSRFNGTQFCKSHNKNLPHGTMETISLRLQTKEPTLVSTELTQPEKIFNREIINGIPYFINCNTGEYYIEEDGQSKKVECPV